MTITFLAPDGVPITAQQFRQSRAALHGGGSGRPLGGRSGFRVDTPSGILTATSTTWTLGPCAAEIDPGASTAQGMYGWSTDANVTGTVRAANSTYARKDIVYIQVNDSTAGDGSGATTAPVLYSYGPEDGTNVPPTLPPRSFLIGTISVPIAGGGSPTVIRNPAVFVAAGAKLPIYSPAERAALTPYLGFEIQRLDLTQVSAAGVREQWNGTNWDHFGVAEYTTASNGLTASTSYNLGAFTAVSGKTTDTSFVTIVSGGGIQVRDAGSYQIDISQRWSAGAVGRAFISLEDAVGAGNTLARTGYISGEDYDSLSRRITLAAGQTVYPKVYQSTGTINVSGSVRVERAA